MHGNYPAVNDLLDITKNINTYKSSSISKKIKINTINSIKFEKVSYTYPQSKLKNIESLTFELKGSSHIGLIGRTGVGKSTILDLLMGLILPKKGIIKVNNIELDKNLIQSWQENVCHVPQSIFLSDNTIASNIAIGENEIDFDRVKFASKLSCLSRDIELMEKGYYTIVGENGLRISGGQKQRIGIARAIYKRKNF